MVWLMKHMLALAITFASATVVLAETPMTDPEFDAYTQGKTLFFNSGGISYGVEEYLPNRRVRWSFLDGACKEGEWFQRDTQICFVYEDSTGPQCWTFFKGDAGLRARFEGQSINSDLYETRQSDEPMICLGPEIGV